MAVVVKLTRVLLLAPVVAAVSVRRPGIPFRANSASPNVAGRTASNSPRTTTNAASSKVSRP